MNTLTFKPSLVYLLFTTIFLVSFSIVYAQSDTTETTQSEEERTTVEQTRAEQMPPAERIQSSERQPERALPTTTQGRQQQVEERRVQLQARAQERIINLAANMSNRMEAAIVRVLDISARLESRISKLSAQGVDTTEAEAALASAKLSIESATLNITEIDEMIIAAVNSEDARKDWTEVRRTFLTTRDHLLTAQTELRACVAALKTALRDASAETGASEAVRMNEPDTTETEATN